MYMRRHAWPKACLGTQPRPRRPLQPLRLSSRSPQEETRRGQGAARVVALVSLDGLHG
jgi:hypothetical protein